MSDQAHSGHEAHADHVLPVSLYLKVYGALLVLTYLTVQISFWALGHFSLPFALAIAVVKAGLVIGFFMHLRYDTRFHSLIFFGTILFLTVFAAFTLFDLTTRGDLVQEQQTFAYEQSQHMEDQVREAEDLAQTPPDQRPQPVPEETAPPAH